MLEKEVLKNPILLECLRTFVKEELDDEDFEIKNLIDFWSTVNEIQTKQHSNESIISLVKQYVDPKSSHFIKALSIDVINSLSSETAEGHISNEKLIAAQQDAFAWLQKQVFPKFFETKAYKTVKAEQDAKNATEITLHISGTERVKFANSSPFIVYVINVAGQVDRWTLYRRYSELRALDTVLRRDVAHMPAFPARRLVGAQRAVFVERRRAALSAYLATLQRHDAAVQHDAYQTFFSVQWHARRSTLPAAALARVRHNARLAIVSRSPVDALKAARAAVAAAPRDADVAYTAAVAYAGANEPIRALEWLSAALSAGYNNFANLKQEIAFNMIRDTTIYNSLLALYPEQQQQQQQQEKIISKLNNNNDNNNNTSNENDNNNNNNNNVDDDDRPRNLLKNPQSSTKPTISIQKPIDKRDDSAKYASFPARSSTHRLKTSGNAAPRSTASSFATTSSLLKTLPVSARLLAGAGFGELPVNVAVSILSWLTSTSDANNNNNDNNNNINNDERSTISLLNASRVCRRWRLLSLAAMLWQSLLQSAPRMADGRPRPRLRRRFFNKALPVLLASYPVSYTRRMTVLDEVFPEFNLESIAAVYASYNGRLSDTVLYLCERARAASSVAPPAPLLLLPTHAPATNQLRVSAPTPAASSATATDDVKVDWRLALCAKAQAAQFGAQTALLLGNGSDASESNVLSSSSSSSSNVEAFIARPVTSVFTMSQTGFVEFERANNPLLLALQRTEFVDLVNILLGDDALLLVTSTTALAGVDITRHFVQHHIVVLDAMQSSAPRKNSRRKRLYSSPLELALLDMLLSDKPDDDIQDENKQIVNNNDNDNDNDEKESTNDSNNDVEDDEVAQLTSATTTTTSTTMTTDLDENGERLRLSPSRRRSKDSERSSGSPPRRESLFDGQPLFPSPSPTKQLSRRRSSVEIDEDDDDDTDASDASVDAAGATAAERRLSVKVAGSVGTVAGVGDERGPSVASSFAEHALEPTPPTQRTPQRTPVKKRRQQLSLATLSGCRGTLNAARDRLRFGVEVANRAGGEKRYQTLRLLRESKVPIGVGVGVHVLFVPRCLQRAEANGSWVTNPADAAKPVPKNPASPRQRNSDDADDDDDDTSDDDDDDDDMDESESDESASSTTGSGKALSAARIDAIKSSLRKPIAALAKRTRKAAANDPEPPPRSTFIPDDESDDDDAEQESLGPVGDAAWRTLPTLVRAAATDAPPFQRALLLAWAHNELFSVLCKPLMAADRAASDADIKLAAQLKRLSFITQKHLGIDEAYENSELWETAISELKALVDVCNPNQKLGCIMNACRVIIYQLQSGGSAASADDFLPHLIWVVLQAKPERLHANMEYIRRYASPEALRMETLYFYTNVEICMSFIETIEASYLKIDPEEYEREMAKTAPTSNAGSWRLSQRLFSRSSSKPQASSSTAKPPENNTVPNASV